jgi:ferric-dicitrate binding protein FerR (iron transport regulator)
MLKPTDERSVTAFEERLRERAGRPPSTPPEVAARRVLAALPGARRSFISWRVAAAAAAVLLVCAAAWVVSRSRGSTAARVAQVAPATLPDNVVQWWLDDGTPVYFVLGGSSSQRGGV